MKKTTNIFSDLQKSPMKKPSTKMFSDLAESPMKKTAVNKEPRITRRTRAQTPSVKRGLEKDVDESIS